MTLRLDYLPIQTNYGSDLIPNAVVEIPLEGGLSRKRQDINYPGHIVQCTWLIDPSEYDVFMGFFRTDLKNSSQPFLLDLVTDIGMPTTHRCRTIGGEPKLIRQSGEGYWLQATLQAEANATHTGYDEDLVVYQSSVSNWQFDGIDDTITMGDVHDKASGVAFSVSGWFASNQGGGAFASEARLFSKRGASGNFSGWGVLMASSAGFLYWAYGGPDSLGARRSEIRTNATWIDGVLHNFVCTKSTNNSVTGLKIYVDGVLQPTTTVFNTFAGSPLNAVSLAIDQGGLFRGLLQHMAIWNKELSASEVTQIYNGGTPGDLLSTTMAANLEGWWKVDGTDTTGASGVIDHSSNNNHGTAGGGLGGASGYHIIYPDVAVNYLPGDYIRIIDSRGTHPTSDIDLDLDGVYEVSRILGRNSIRLVAPELTNTDWYKLYAIDEDYGGVDSGSVISTVTKVPT